MDNVLINKGDPVLKVSGKMQQVIAEIHKRGNTAEIKERKDDVIVLEVIRKIVYRCGK